MIIPIILTIITIITGLYIYSHYALDEMCNPERTNMCILFIILLLGIWGTYYAYFT